MKQFHSPLPVHGSLPREKSLIGIRACSGIQYYEDRYRSQQVELLKKKAAKLGLQIVEIQTVGV
jgi:hypothetical protein